MVTSDFSLVDKPYQLQKNCVISAVGKSSLHREWINEHSDFDLHLIVYDDSFEEFQHDTPFVCSNKGYKLKLIYHYLQSNPKFLNNYKYFLLPDDDVSMDSEKISSLFQIMEKYHLQIAQPGLSDSYYYYEHTLRDKFCVLHYTNFVEIMIPCFSREALKKILFTFNENNSGWGVEIHWPALIGFTGKEIAVIDQVYVSHTRPTQSFSRENVNDFNNYLKKYNLKWEIVQTGHILQQQEKTDENNSNTLITKRTTYQLIDTIVISFIKRIDNLPIHAIRIQDLIRKIVLLTNYSRISGKIAYLDMLPALLKKANENLIRTKNDNEFLSGILHISWCVEHLAQQGIIENNTDEVLKEFTEYLVNYPIKKNTCFNINQLIGFARYYITRMNNPHFGINKTHYQEKSRLVTILITIENWSKTQSTNTTPQELIDCILLLCEAKKIVVLPEIDLALQRITEQFWKTPINNKLPHLLKTYVQLLAAENADNKSLKEKTIYEAGLYLKTYKECCFSQLLDIYLLYKIYQYTKDKRIKSHILEILNNITKANDASAVFKQIANNMEEEKESVKNSLLIRSGLILVSILSDKNLKLESCIL